MSAWTPLRQRRLAALAATLLRGSAGEGRPADEAPTALPERLGATEEELRAEFGDALQPAKIERPLALTEKIMQARRRTDEAKASGISEPPGELRDLFAEQKRLVREVGGDVRRVEYEIFREKVYRIRWQLSDRFERPLMNPLVAHLSDRFGEPFYNQQIEGKLASGKATLYRAGWRRGSRSLELRQLHPMSGGPLFLTLSDQTAIRAIAASRGSVLPEPESSGVWWQERLSRPVILTPEERDLLLKSIDALISQINF